MNAICTNSLSLKDFQKASIYPPSIPAFLCKLLFLKYLAHLTLPESLSLGNILNVFGRHSL